MKNKFSIPLLIVMAFAFAPGLSAQSNSKNVQSAPLSDTPSGYTYDFNKTRDLIIERITDPKTSNAEAQTFLNASDFPAAPKGKTIDAAYKDKIKQWMEKN